MLKKIILYNSIFSFILLSIVNIIGLQKDYTIMFAYSLSSLGVFTYILHYELKNFQGIRLTLLLIAMYILRLVLPSITQSIQGIKTGIVLLNNTYDISDSVFESCIMMNIYYMIFYYFMYRLQGNLQLENYLKPMLEGHNVSILTVSLFFIGTIYDLSTTFLNINPPFFINYILGGFTTLALFFVSIYAATYHTTSRHRILIILILCELIRTILSGFMKAPIMYAVTFYILYHILRAKYTNSNIINYRNITIGIAALFFLSYIVFPFISIKRQIAEWDIAAGGIVNAKYSNFEILEDVITGNYIIENNGTNTTDRFDALSTNAFFVNFINKKNSYSLELLKENIQALTPRMFNPDKHVSRTGLMATAIIQYGDSKAYQNAKSNSYVGQMASAYMIGGLLMVIILAVFNGYIISSFYVFLVKNINNVFALIFFSQLFVTSLSGFEEVHDGGVTRCIFYAIYSAIIIITNKVAKLINN